MSAKDRRNERTSAARRRAEQHESGFETTLFKLPDGMSFFNLSPGVHEIDILPFIAGKGNPYANEGELYFERTFHCYRDVGIQEKRYVALCKLGLPDPIQDWKKKMANNPAVDPEVIRSYTPKERQIFLVRDKKEPDKIKLLESSHFGFGKLLDNRVQNSPEDSGWDMFYFADEGGMSLRLTVTEEAMGTGKFNKVTAIDFMPRKVALPEALANHGLCLDDMLIIPAYDTLLNIFLGTIDPAHGGTRSTEVPKEGGGSQQTTETKQEEKKAVHTAEQHGIKKGDEVVYQKANYTVLKISPDGTALTLSDANDELVFAVCPSECKAREVVTEQPKTETTKPPVSEAAKTMPKAADFGIEVRDEVVYQKVIYTVAKISPDGTSLTLMDADDNVVRAVPPENVKKAPKETVAVVETKKETSMVQEANAEAGASAEDEWNF